MQTALVIHRFYGCLRPLPPVAGKVRNGEVGAGSPRRSGVGDGVADGVGLGDTLGLGDGVGVGEGVTLGVGVVQCSCASCECACLQPGLSIECSLEATAMPETTKPRATARVMMMRFKTVVSH